MDFDTFAKVYALIRFRCGRADDLFEDAVGTSSCASTQVVGEDDEIYSVKAHKKNGRAHVHVGRHDRGGVVVLVHVFASLAKKQVAKQKGGGVFIDEADNVIEALTSLNENGRETRAYYEENHHVDTPLEEAQEDRNYAEKAARLILAGIGGRPELDPSETFLVVQQMVAVLSDPQGMNLTGRVENALCWAMHPDTQPEWAIYLARWVSENIPVENQNQYSLDVLRERYPVVGGTA
jgi:hypothetical protein